MISQQFGNLPTKVVALPFDKSCSVQGTVTLELELTAGIATPTPVFKKTGMDINQLTASGSQIQPPKKPAPSGSRIKGLQTSKTGVRNQGGSFKFWKSGGKKTGRKFGVKLDPQNEAVPEILLQIIPHLEESGMKKYNLELQKKKNSRNNFC